MRVLPLVAALIMTTSLFGCGSSPETRPGNPPVYRRIEALNDCAALKRELDEAEASYQRELKAGPDREAYRTIARSYVRTAETRMKQVGCN